MKVKSLKLRWIRVDHELRLLSPVSLISAMMSTISSEVARRIRLISSIWDWKIMSMMLKISPNPSFRRVINEVCLELIKLRRKLEVRRRRTMTRLWTYLGIQATIPVQDSILSEGWRLLRAHDSTHSVLDDQQNKVRKGVKEYNLYLDLLFCHHLCLHSSSFLQMLSTFPG